jgi:hypothetical protein
MCTFFFFQVPFTKEPLSREEKDAKEGRTLIGEFDILTLKLISTIYEFLKETMSKFSVFSENVGTFPRQDTQVLRSTRAKDRSLLMSF